MHLRDELESISSANTVVQIDEMLNKAQVSINWYGQRMVTVDGYEGSVEINKLALKYLGANAFQKDANLALQERLNCFNLWGRVQKLYADSDAELNKTWLFKYLTPLMEFRPYCRVWARDPMAIIGEWAGQMKSSSLFKFTPEEFDTHFPNEMFLETEISIDGTIKSIASEKQVKVALAR